MLKNTNLSRENENLKKIENMTVENKNIGFCLKFNEFYKMEKNQDKRGQREVLATKVGC